MTKELTIKDNISSIQLAGFLKAIESGLSVEKAATKSGIHFAHTADLLDLLNRNGLQAAVNLAIHNQICTIGKELAWAVAQELMTNPYTKPAVRWAAARWTLEASGEGIGQTRNSRSKPKDLHEMSEAELQRFIEKASKFIDGNAVDVTPETDYGELFD